jgi:chromosome segregation ATPase
MYEERIKQLEMTVAEKQTTMDNMTANVNEARDRRLQYEAEIAELQRRNHSLEEKIKEVAVSCTHANDRIKQAGTCMYVLSHYIYLIHVIDGTGIAGDRHALLDKVQSLETQCEQQRLAVERSTSVIIL